MSCVATLGLAADDLETLDADFLSYLAELEGEDDDWTIVELPPAKQPAPAATSQAPAQPATADAAKKSPLPASPPSSDEQEAKP